jgi:hypothetical protein
MAINSVKHKLIISLGLVWPVYENIKKISNESLITKYSY